LDLLMEALYSNIINTSCAILLPSILHGHDLT
jgi:hypothetical protein